MIWCAPEQHIICCRLVGLRHNVFFGAVPKPGDKRQGPPRDQCHDSAAIAHARRGFAALEDLAATSCAAEYRWDPGLLAHQVADPLEVTQTELPELTLSLDFIRLICVVFPRLRTQSSSPFMTAILIIIIAAVFFTPLAAARVCIPAYWCEAGICFAGVMRMQWLVCIGPGTACQSQLQHERTGPCYGCSR